jgi:hypothetical protein
MFFVPPMASRLPIAGSGDFGTSPFLGNSSGKPVLASAWLDGGAESKAQQRREIKCREPSGGARQPICPAPVRLANTATIPDGNCPGVSGNRHLHGATDVRLRRDKPQADQHQYAG